jgi:quercetin dioxygenase-like cupin family protein
MFSISLNELPLQEIATPADASIGARYDFPITANTSATSSSVVVFEVDPGKRLGKHRDSAEEILLILSGEAEAMIGDERARLSAGDMALVPAWAIHDVSNVGTEPLRVVGFFASATPAHIFQEPLLPNTDLALIVHAQGSEEAYALEAMSQPSAV